MQSRLDKAFGNAEEDTEDGRYYKCGHRRLTYDGFMLPDVCE